MAATTKTTDDVDEIAPTPTQIAQPPFQPVTTIYDEAADVRRLVPSPEYNWTPAPVDPTEADIARAEQRLAREEAEANGEPYELPDGTVVQTTPEGLAEQNAKAAEEQAKAEAEANQQTTTTKTTKSTTTKS
jgi:hypothetical protein